MPKFLVISLSSVLIDKCRKSGRRVNVFTGVNQVTPCETLDEAAEEMLLSLLKQGRNDHDSIIDIVAL